MDKYMTSFTGDKSRSFSGDSDVSLRSSTPINVEAEVTGQVAEIQSSLGEILEKPVEEEVVLSRHIYV